MAFDFLKFLSLCVGDLENVSGNDLLGLLLVLFEVEGRAAGLLLLLLLPAPELCD